MLYIKWNILGYYTKDQVRSYKKNNSCYHKALKGQSKNYSEPREFFFLWETSFQKPLQLTQQALTSFISY